MLTESEYRLLKAACSGLATGRDYRVEDYLENLLITVLDFQLKVKSVDNAIAHFRTHHRDSLRTHEDLKRFLASHPGTKEGNLAAALSLWGNRCWTRLGFLRVLQS